MVRRGAGPRGEDRVAELVAQVVQRLRFHPCAGRSKPRLEVGHRAPAVRLPGRVPRALGDAVRLSGHAVQPGRLARQGTHGREFAREARVRDATDPQPVRTVIPQIRAQPGHGLRSRIPSIGVPNTGIHSADVHSDGVHNTVTHSGDIHSDRVHNAGVPNAAVHRARIHSGRVHSTAVHRAGVHNTGVHSTGNRGAGVHSTGIHSAGVHSAGGAVGGREPVCPAQRRRVREGERGRR